MTEPTGGPPPVPDPASAPPPAAPAAPAAAPSAWQAPAPIVAPAGPAPGLAYAGLGIRIVAYIIDGFLLGILTALVYIALGALFVGTAIGGSMVMALIFGVLLAIASMVISAAYFIWGWTNPEMRASLGQRVIGLNTLNAADGATLTRPQAVRRWAFLYGIFAVAWALQLAFGGSDLSTLGTLVGLLSLGYLIFLLWTTYQSPKKQGYHDVQAGTVVVKRA
jgi:uncharacterized RDD family membrane protein YckC